MSGEGTIKVAGGDVDFSGTEARPRETGAIDEPKNATGELVDVVTEATWNEVLSRLGGLPSNPLPLWMMLATRILRAVADGERDPQRIKRFALDGLEDHDGAGKSHRS